jgi:dihydrofolate reductase
VARIVISENVSLDGVVEDPTGEEGSAGGGWILQMGDRDRAAWTEVESDEAERAEALLLGRRSDAWFGSRWNEVAGAWADRLRSMPKYVVSSTVQDAVWVNSTVLRGDVVGEVSRLKRELDGDVVVYGSLQLVQTLMEHDLVDEIRLMVFPVVLGAGRRLYGETAGARSLRLLRGRTVGDGLTHLAYEVVRNGS